MPEPERSIEELVDVFEVTTVSAVVLGTSGTEDAKDKARAALLRAVARLREENTGLRALAEAQSGHIETVNAAFERVVEERDEARAKLAGALTVMRLTREQMPPVAPYEFRPHPEGRGP